MPHLFLPATCHHHPLASLLYSPQWRVCLPRILVHPLRRPTTKRNATRSRSRGRRVARRRLSYRRRPLHSGYAKSTHQLSAATPKRWSQRCRAIRLLFLLTPSHQSLVVGCGEWLILPSPLVGTFLTATAGLRLIFETACSRACGLHPRSCHFSLSQ